VHQLQGEKTLLEVVSQAGGLNPTAGHAIRITRRKEWGPIPLPGAHEDETGQYYVAEVGVKEIMEARAPEKNILVKPNDVITVPKGELVYVMGAVKKSGGFVLGDRETVTVLQALSMAEGMDSYAQSGHAKILRRTSDPEKRQEIALNLKRIIEGRDHDVEMQSDDILFVPLGGGRNLPVQPTLFDTPGVPARGGYLPPAGNAYSGGSAYPQEFVEDSDAGSLVEYWRTLRRRRGLLILITCIGCLAALLITLPQPPVYQARTTLEILELNENFMNMKDVTQVAQPGMNSNTDIPTQIQILQSESLLDGTSAALAKERKQGGVARAVAEPQSAWRRILNLPEPMQREWRFRR
jgi:protein involved in polysaccharide export with SLBB domain